MRAVTIIEAGNTAPREQDVREALQRVVRSDEFRGSPQLAAFLTFVVARTLEGAQDRIKGYTIAVEALGRDESFDPQADPIVRVEATRLRRALDRYYANAGASDPLVIRIERGSYVPQFAWSDGAAPATPTPETAADAAAEAPLVPAALPAMQPGEPAVAAPAQRRAFLVVSGVTAVVVAVAASLAYLQGGVADPASQRAARADQSALAAAARFSAGPPVVDVKAFDELGATENVPLRGRGLTARLRDGLARFEDVRVLAGLSGAANADFEVGGWIEAHADGTISASVRLVDLVDGDVIWTRQFERLRVDAGGSLENDIVRQVATALAQPYGVIQTRVRSRLLTAGAGSQRVSCLLDAFEYWRSYEPQRFQAARACLERLTATDPSFALGHATYAQILLEAWRLGLPSPRAERQPLETALDAARRAVTLRPDSARAHQALLDVHFHRREIDQALSAGERALMINPFDTDVMADYGARLVAIGRVEQGARLLRQAMALNPARPAWVDFFLFLAASLRDDRVNAAFHANQIRTDDYVLGLVARAIVAQNQGQTRRAAETVERLVALEPLMASAPRTVLERYFPRPAIIDHLMDGLNRAGLTPRG